MPVPIISQPVFTDATEVTVTGVVPGATVFLYVGGAFRSQVTALGTFSSLPLGSQTLTVGESIQVTQALCSAVPAIFDDGPSQAVAIGPRRR